MIIIMQQRKEELMKIANDIMKLLYDNGVTTSESDLIIREVKDIIYKNSVIKKLD